MEADISLWTGLRAIYARMSSARRRQFFIVLALMLCGAVAELGTIGAVIPFLAALSGSSGSRLSNLLPESNRLVVAAAIFILFALAAGLVRLALARSTRNFIFGLGHELTSEIQRRVLSQPLGFHIHRNTSTLLTALNKTEMLVYDILLPLMHAVTAGTIAVCILILLVFVAPVTTVVAAATFDPASVSSAKGPCACRRGGRDH